MSPSFDSVAQSLTSEGQVPGLVAVVRTSNGEIAWSESGFADLSLKIPATRETVFGLASVSKQFTAVAIMILVEQGLLLLEDPLSNFMARPPEQWKSVTIRQLLTHTSGLPDYLHGNTDLIKSVSTANILRRVARHPLKFGPGTKWEYSNSGYVALGHIVSVVSGQAFGDFVIENLTRPAGMKTASIPISSSQEVNSAVRYVKDSDWTPAPPISASYSSLGDGMLLSSAVDLLAWHDNLLRGALLKSESWRTLWNPHPLSWIPGYGMGWEIDRQGERPRLSHRGEYDGVYSILISDLETGECAIALANTDDANYSALELALRRCLTPLPARK